MQFYTLYNFIYEFTKNFEETVTREQLIESFKKAMGSFFAVEDVKIYLIDEYSYLLKDFIKPWENFSITSKNSDIQKYFDDFLTQKSTFELIEKILYFPIMQKHKTLGIVKLIAKEKISSNSDFFEILPLIKAQISMFCTTLKDRERIKLSLRFHQIIKNIAQITQTQYELDYILPIMGEMIDKFITDHLIYIFLKNKNKKEYKLIWPNNCSDNKIWKYLENINPKSKTMLEQDGKMGIFPLKVDNKTYGAIVAYNHLDKITPKEIEYLEEITTQAQLTITRAKSYIEVLEFATLDALTGYNNRRQFEKRLKETIATAKRRNQSLCCIMSDIDFFKKVNDTYGHSVGDYVLKTVAKTMKKELREEDIASRYGGEEFVFLLPDTNIKKARIVAERLRLSIEKKKINIEDFKIDNTKEIFVTISIGVSKFNKTDKTPEILYKKADEALYKAKNEGRNRVVVNEE